MQMREIRNAFDQIHADEALKASAKRAMKNAREKRRSGSAWIMRSAAAAASLLICIFSIGSVFLLQRPVSYISIDVNPSIELSLNRLNRVVAANAWNDDAERVLRDVDTAGMPYMQAIEYILNSEAMKDYLTEEAVITITVASDNPKGEAALMEEIENNAVCRQYGSCGYRADAAVIEEAHRCGMSFGKYRAYYALLEQGYSITEQECREMSMREIHGLLHGNGHGNGYGNGHGEGHGNGGKRQYRGGHGKGR